MRVLLACDIETDGAGNPYTLQLLNGLEAHPDVNSIRHGRSWMHVPEVTFDVVQIQWPEALIGGWKEPTEADLQRVRAALRRWCRKAALVVTVHNEYPHYRDTPAFRALYQMVYDGADGVIHMGEVSKEIVRKRYQDELQGVVETVIPHGNYNWFPNEVSRQTAREALSIEEDENVILCFGELRASEEVDILLDGFEAAQVPNKYLLIAGRLPHSRWMRNWKYLPTRIPLWTNSRVRLDEAFILPERVQHYLKAADALIIPRRKLLNSGNVILGFTFGRVVVGPNVGVAGDMLRRTGNPVFCSTEPQEVGSAIEQAIDLAGSDLGKANATFAREKLDWSYVTGRHVAFYKNVKEYVVDSKQT